MELITDFYWFLISVIFISLSGVMAPGPLFAVTVTKGSRDKLAGVLISFGHGIIEFPLMFLIYFGFAWLLASSIAYQIISLVGGLILIYMGLHMLKTREEAKMEFSYSRYGSLVSGILATGANPYFILWWATIGFALVINASVYGFLGFLIFAITHWSCDLLWNTFVCATVFKSRRFWTKRVSQIVFGFCFLVLIGFGMWFLISALSFLIIRVGSTMLPALNSLDCLSEREIRKRCKLQFRWKDVKEGRKVSNKEFHVGRTKIRLVQGDITDIDTEAIVNAANSTLMGGGGVDAAIHRKGGPKILYECKRIRATEWPEGLPTGKAVITSGGNLKAKYVIHTVGPIWHGGSVNELELLKEAYRNSMHLAVSKGLKTIAFPSISTGAYGYPIEKASRIALSTVKKFLEKEDKVDKVVFVLFSKHDLEIYKKSAEETM